MPIPLDAIIAITEQVEVYRSQIPFVAIDCGRPPATSSAGEPDGTLQRFIEQVDCCSRGAIKLYQSIQKIDILLHESAFDDPDSFDEDDLRQLVQHYRELADSLPLLVRAAEIVTSNGLESALLPEAIRRVEEAVSIVRAFDRDRAESGEETPDWLDDLRRDAVSQARNGEAVSFDEFGR